MPLRSGESKYRPVALPLVLVATPVYTIVYRRSSTGVEGRELDQAAARRSALQPLWITNAHPTI